MAKRKPRVPLPAKIVLPGTEQTIQVNHCKMPHCVANGLGGPESEDLPPRHGAHSV